MDIIQQASKYVGIPWVESGRTKDGLDCYGLVRIIYAEVLGKEIPDFKYATEGTIKQAEEIYKNLTGNVTKLSADIDHVPGDIVLIEYMGEACHVGIFLGGKSIMHTTAHTGAIIMQLSDMERGRKLSSRIQGWYRWQ